MHCLLSNNSERIFLEAIDQNFAPSSSDYIQDSEEMYLLFDKPKAVSYKHRMIAGKAERKRLKISDVFSVDKEYIAQLRWQVIRNILYQGQLASN